MADIVLSFAMTPYDRVLPLITGEVKPAGITLDYQGMPGAVPGVFYDQIKFQRYDLSEMSFSSFLVERAKGWPYRLLRSEEHTSELQSRPHLVCRLLLEKKKKNKTTHKIYRRNTKQLYS